VYGWHVHPFGKNSGAVLPHLTRCVKGQVGHKLSDNDSFPAPAVCENIWETYPF
jgi:hypothetical protein